MKIDFDRIFDKLNSKSNTIYYDKSRLQKLIQDTKKKAENNKELQGLWSDIKLVIELIKDFVKGEYKDIPKSSLILIIGGFLYLVNPFDIIPDFIIGGFIDDAAVLAYVFKKIAAELTHYKEWIKTREDIIEIIDYEEDEE